MRKIESNKEENKKKLLAMLKEVWARTKDMPEEEGERIVDEAVRAVRKEKKP